MTFINPDFQFEEEDEYTELIMQQHDNSFEFQAPSHQKHEIEDKSNILSHQRQINDTRSSDVSSVTEQEEQEIEETINEFSNVFRNEVMDRFFELRSRLAHHYLKRIRKLEREKEVLCIEHRNTVDKLQGSIAKRDHFLMRFKHLTLGMADTLAKQRERKEMNNRVRLILYKWREWTQSKKKQEQTLRIVRLHHQKSVLSKVLHEWRALTLKSKAENSRLLYESKMHAKTSELKNDYESQMEDLALELQKAQELLRAESKDKELLQDNLRKALLRGVCAMNNKFLEIIHDGRISSDEAARLTESTEGFADELEATITDGLTKSFFDSQRGQQHYQHQQRRYYEDENMDPNGYHPRSQVPRPTPHASNYPANTTRNENGFSFQSSAAEQIHKSNVKVFRETPKNSVNKIKQHRGIASMMQQRTNSLAFNRNK